MWFLLVIAVSVARAETWVIELEQGLKPEVFAYEHSFTYEGAVDFLPGKNFHRFSSSPTRARTEQSVREAQGVKWAERQVARRHFKRVADPLYESQWHLHTHPFSVEADRAPANVTGRGITVAIVDDGLQHTHPDIHANYDAQHSYDFNDVDMDPMPVHRDSGHGTSAAGVAAAVKENGHCGRGAAPGAKIVGLRTIDDAVTDLVEAQALSHNGIGVVDIYSCSWGPEDNGISMVSPGNLVQETLATYAGQLRGRLGKGNVYVWASGNGRDNHDTCAFDGYASNQFVIPIGAISHEGQQSWYSEGCAALMAVTPSSGAMKGITTVDLIGSAGYDPSECTANFGGTSAAAPLAAGVIALILQERPDLTWRDVKHVIAKGAVPVHSEDPDWHMNRAGYRHSHKYGFGLLKVPSLLITARSHRLVPSRFKTWRSPTTTINTRTGFIPFNLTIPVHGADITFIEHVTLKTWISHNSRGSLTIVLRSPEGTISRLAEERPKDKTDGYPYEGWTFTSVRHWGESTSNGNWTVMLDDNNPRTRTHGHFNAYELAIFGF